MEHVRVKYLVGEAAVGVEDSTWRRQEVPLVKQYGMPFSLFAIVKCRDRLVIARFATREPIELEDARHAAGEQSRRRQRRWGVQVRRTSVKGAIEGVAAFKDSSLAVIVCDKRADKAPRPGNNRNPRLVEDVDAL